MLELPLDALRAGRTRTRMERRGIAFETDAYVVGRAPHLGRHRAHPRDLLERTEELLLPVPRTIDLDRALSGSLDASRIRRLRRT